MLRYLRYGVLTAGAVALLAQPALIQSALAQSAHQYHAHRGYYHRFTCPNTSGSCMCRRQSRRSSVPPFMVRSAAIRKPLRHRIMPARTSAAISAAISATPETGSFTTTARRADHPAYSQRGTGEDFMSFLSALFGRLAPAQPEKVPGAGRIQRLRHSRRAVQERRPVPDGGVIEREIGGVRQEHRFIRADAFASYDDAVTFSSPRRGSSSICKASGCSGDPECSELSGRAGGVNYALCRQPRGLFRWRSAPIFMGGGCLRGPPGVGSP